MALLKNDVFIHEDSSPYDSVTIRRATESLLLFVEKTLPKANINTIKDALDFTNNFYYRKKRSSGEDYIIHPIAVAMIIAELGLDTHSIVTALLYEVVEDTTTSLMKLEEKFGQSVSDLVDGVNKFSRIEKQSFHLNLNKHADNLRKLLLAVSQDIRVLVVKLADRLHNMRTISHVTDKDKRKHIAIEALEVHAPLAERIGIHKIKVELQDIAFAELFPEIRNAIIVRLNFLKNQGYSTVAYVVQEIENVLSNNGHFAFVHGREKAPYSIWKKVEKKSIDFSDLSDIFAFRIITNSVTECYTILGIIHNAYHVINDSFQDFISNPKSNGYQSIHTMIIGPNNKPIEIQIRTQEMHEVSEIGIASHWSYKQGEKQNIENNKQYKLLHQIKSVLENSNGSEVLLNNTKIQMHDDEVFCFTPKGSLVALPKCATALDFAFAVHSDVGLTCSGAKINGSMMPLNTMLNNGDQIEIFKSDLPRISASWIDIVVTDKAKTIIKKFLINQSIKDFISLGQSMLSNALIDSGHTDYYDKINDDIAIKHFNKSDMQALLLSIGKCEITTESVINVIHNKNTSILSAKYNPFALLKKRKNQKRKNQKSQFMTSNAEIISDTQFIIATCCYPLPGEKVVGVPMLSNSTKKMLVHASDCDFLGNLANKIKLSEFSWIGNDSDKYYISRIKLSIPNEIGSFAYISKVIADYGINMIDLKVIDKSLRFFDILIDVEVKGVKQVHSLICNLKSIGCVSSIYRTYNNIR